jgi:hypothetical protein
VRRRLFLFALERGFLDAVLDRLIVAPFYHAARWMSRLDQFLCAVVAPAAPAVVVEDVEDRDE